VAGKKTTVPTSPETISIFRSAPNIEVARQRCRHSVAGAEVGNRVCVNGAAQPTNATLTFRYRITISPTP
jgi:hypothetical protein